MPSKMASELLDFDMDRYLNPWLPHNRVGYLPAPISRFLGYRKNTYKEPPALVQWFSAFVGAFIGILLIGAIFKYAPGVVDKHPPIIVASLGASAILDYSAIRSPVAQPRNSVLGHGFSAIVGVAIAKLFMLNSNFHDIQWIAGAVACGATAVIATTQANVISMGWCQNTLQQKTSHASTAADKPDAEQITITATGIHIPSHMRLSPQEKAILAQFQGRMHKA
ncbi:hypothetical protein Q7P35_007875 [Cladosporium inversicolor]